MSTPRDGDPTTSLGTSQCLATLSTKKLSPFPNPNLPCCHLRPPPRVPQVYKRMKLQVVISAVEMWTRGDQVTATHSLEQTLQVFTSWCQKDAAVRIEYDHVELLL